jgi:hypothetical protein
MRAGSNVGSNGVDDFERHRQLSALVKAWLATPDLDGDIETVAMAYRHADRDAADLTRGLCDGYAHDLDWLESRAERLVAEGEALARLVAHVKATNPRARRRARRAHNATT